MKTLVSLFLVLPFFLGAQEENVKILSKEVQIATAVLPLPENQKEGAMVYGYNADGEFVVLRKGTNNMVCIGDNPYRKGISSSCYSVKLEPFMARGRELNAQGKSQDERNEIRGREIESGALPMPREPSMLYVFFGKEEDYNTTTGALPNGKFRYVIYTPFATTESTGLPDKPHAPGMPWLMDPGTHRAHIMVGPFN